MEGPVVLLPDEHIAPRRSEEGGADKRARSCALQAIELVKPVAAYHIGDIGEWDSVSHWKYKRRKRPPRPYIKEDILADAEAVNAGLDEWDAALGNIPKTMIEGNHEVWLDHFCEEDPDDVARYSPERLMRLEERGWGYAPYGEYVSVAGSKLRAYHGGHWMGINHTRAHCLHLSASVAYGHTHDIMNYSLNRLGGYHAAWSIGCLCALKKKFLRGRPTNWAHGFAIVEVEKNRKFHFQQVRITNGKCFVYGKKVTA